MADIVTNSMTLVTNALEVITGNAILATLCLGGPLVGLGIGLFKRFTRA